MTPDLNRRNFLKTTAGAAGIAGLAGCNTDGGDEDPDGTDTDDSSTTEPDPTYSLQTSALEYDLTDLATSEANQHDQAYVEDNYSAELEVTVLENGQGETDLEDLSEVHLENQEGETIETTEDGYVPEYAVEDGQELTVRAEVNGEELTETVTVSKNLPDNFLVDAQMMEGGETVYETPWSTPYEFDSHVTDRQAFLDQRAEKRDEIAQNNLVEKVDDQRMERLWNELEAGEHERYQTEEEKKEAALSLMRSAIHGSTDFDGVGVDRVEELAVNEEKLMENLDFFPYEEVFIGGFTNPEEPEYDENGNKQIDGVQVDSQVAYVDGDWYHIGNTGIIEHIDNAEDIEMVDATASSYAANSVLAEFEEGEMDNLEQSMKDYYTGEAVTSPVTLSSQMTDQNEMLTGFPTSWALLESIRDNQEWDSTMNGLELAADQGLKNADNESGERPERFTATVGDNPESLNLLSMNGPESLSGNGPQPYQQIPETADLAQIKQEFLQ
jgi:hypothetical protein